MHNSIKDIEDLDDANIANHISCEIQELTKYIYIDKACLTIICQNIRSIYRNIDNFYAMLSQLDFEMDVIVLTECWLDKYKPIPQIPNYTAIGTTYKLNQNDGVAIYAKSSLEPKFKEIKLAHSSCIQLTVLDITILGIYRSPSNTVASCFIESLSNHLDKIKSNNNIIITGDININLLQHENELHHDCINRTDYLNMLATHGILTGHTLHTRESSCLDHFMLKLNKIKCDASIAVLDTTVTDHKSIFISISKIKSVTHLQKVFECVNFDTAYDIFLH